MENNRKSNVNRASKTRAGFTLIELVAMMAVIAVSSLLPAVQRLH